MHRQGRLRSAALALLLVLPAVMPHLAGAANDSINCPRPAVYWARQCRNEQWYGQLPYSAMSLIAEEVGRRSSYFIWPAGTEFECFASVLSPPTSAGIEELARREFAAFLATISAGEMGVRTATDQPVGLVGEMEVSCDGLSSETVKAMIEEIDSLFIVLDPLPDGDDGAGAVYLAITSALRDLNGGIGIETTCDIDRASRPLDPGAGYMVIGIGDHDPSCPDGGGEVGDPG